MKIRSFLIAGTAALALGAVPALAQNAPRAPSDDAVRSGTPSMPAPRAESGARQQTTVLTVIKNDDVMVQPYDINVGKLEGMDVIGANGQKVGDVEDVLADQSGKAVAVSIDAGSLLQMNSKEIIMQLNALQMRDGKLHTSMSKEQIRALPDHNDQRDTGGAGSAARPRYTGVSGCEP